MDTNNQPKACNPAVTRLKSEYSLLSTEISSMNKELLMLKNVIRDKQKDLRKINIAIIQKATRSPFLSIIPSSSPLQLSTQESTRAKIKLTCHQGGKN